MPSPRERAVRSFSALFRKPGGTPCGSIATMTVDREGGRRREAAQPSHDKSGGRHMSIYGFRAAARAALTIALAIIAAAAHAQFGSPPQPRPEATLAAAPAGFDAR